MAPVSVLSTLVRKLSRHPIRVGLPSGARVPSGVGRSIRALGVAGVLASLPMVVSAQVIEIGPGGVSTLYDRPAVFGVDGVTSIAPQGREEPAARRISGGRVQGGKALGDAARAAELSPELIEAMAWRESGGRSGAVSAKGALGEMQLMPGTARSLHVDPRDTRQNYRGGAAYMRRMMARYDGDLVRALAAYNAGAGAVDRYGGVPPYRETRAYVAAIMDRLSRRADEADR